MKLFMAQPVHPCSYATQHNRWEQWTEATFHSLRLHTGNITWPAATSSIILRL